MKRIYVAVEIQVLFLDKDDICTTSNPYNGIDMGVSIEDGELPIIHG